MVRKPLDSRRRFGGGAGGDGSSSSLSDATTAKHGGIDLQGVEKSQCYCETG